MKERKHQTPGFKHELQRNWVLFLMILPTVLFFFVFAYLPMAGGYFAFTKFNFNDGLWGSPFVGLANFEYLFESNILWNITKNTIFYNVLFIIFGTISSIAAAIFLSELPGKWFRKTTQSIMFFPYFISFVLLNAFVYNVLNYEFGTLNNLLSSMGYDPVNVYMMPWVWKYILVAFYVWKNLGYGTVIYIAAILSIDAEVNEAAHIDGANIFQRVRHITLPHLVPTFIIVLMFNIGSIMRGQFELFYQTIGNNGQLYNATDIIDTFVYRTLTQNFDMGMSSAAGIYQSVFGLILVLTVNWTLRKTKPEYALF